MEIPMLHPSARPAAQKGQLMVSNFFDVLEDQSSVQDSAEMRALNEHPEVEAPHALREHPEVVVPQVSHFLRSLTQPLLQVLYIVCNCVCTFFRKSSAVGSTILRADSCEDKLCNELASCTKYLFGNDASYQYDISAYKKPHFISEKCALAIPVFESFLLKNAVCGMVRTKDIVSCIKMSTTKGLIDALVCAIAKIHDDHGFQPVTINSRVGRRLSRQQRWMIWSRSLPVLGHAQCLNRSFARAIMQVDDLNNSAKIEDHSMFRDLWSANNDVEQAAQANSILESVRTIRSSKRTSLATFFDHHNSNTPEFTDLVLPVAVLIYSLYRSRTMTDCVVALVSFIDRLSAKDGHARARIMASWASAYFASNKTIVLGQLRVIHEYFKTLGETHMQSDDYVGVLNNITSGITKSSHVKALVYLSAFSFMGLSAAYTGVAPSFNDFSKKALSLSSRIEWDKTETGVTLGLITHAFTLCSELCSSFMSQGFKAFWTNDVRVLSKFLEDGRELLTKASTFEYIWAYKDMVDLGVKLVDYERTYSEFEPRYNSYKVGSNIRGISFNAETGVAMIWSDIKKVAAAVKTAHIHYKSVMASVAFREAPFCIELFGGSSLGKSALTQYISKMFCMYEGIPPEAKYVYTVNPAQQYLDGYHPWQPVFVLDDVTTVREKYLSQGGDPQLVGLIQYINNVALLTNQASLERKDTTPFLSKYVIVTTNTKDLNAHQYVNNAPAILRRVKWFVTVEIDPNYRDSGGALDGDKCVQWTNSVSGEFPPFWRYTVERCDINNSGGGMANVWHKVLTNVDKDTFLVWLRDTTMDHWAKQKTLVKHVNGQSFKICDQCKMPSGCKHAAGCNQAGSVVQHEVLDDACVVASTVFASCCTSALCAGLIAVCRNLWNSGTQVLANVVDKLVRWRDNFRSCFAFCVGAISDLAYCYVYYRESLDASMYWMRWFLDVLHYGTQCWMWWYMGLWYGAFYSFALSLLPPRAAVSSVISYKIMLRSATVVGVATLAAGVVYGLSRKGKKLAADAHVDEPDWSAHVAVPTWGQGRARPYDGQNLVTAWSSNSRCTVGNSHDGAFSKFQRNCFVCLITSDHGKSRSNGFVYKSGYIIMNAHAFARHKGMDCVLTLAYMQQENELGKPGLEKPQNYTMCRVTASDMLFDDKRDLVMIRVVTETRAGLSDFIVGPGTNNYAQDPQVMGRNMDGSLFVGSIRHKRVVNNVAYGDQQFHITQAIHYDSTLQFKAGHSGSMILLHSGRLSVGDKGMLGICAIHSGVLNMVGGEEGFATTFDSGVLNTMRLCLDRTIANKLNGFAGRLGDGASNYVASASMHSTVMVDDAVFDLHKGSLNGHLGPTHHKSAVTWLDYDAGKDCVSLTVYGALTGDSRNKQGTNSSYRVTPWSSLLEAKVHHSVLGDLRNVYLPAKVPNNELWQVHRTCLLDLCGGNVRGPDPDALECAIVGYVADVIERVRLAGKDQSWSMIQPLSYHEVINGRDGIYDGVVKKTGGGFGYPGPKTKHITVLDEPIPGLKKSGAHWTFDDDVMKSVEEADRLLRSGKDPRFVYTCHLKDEVRAADKIKDYNIRMICGASIPCTILIRKYLLSLVVFMLQNPIATESAVGINVESRQWNDLAQYLRSKGGDDRFIAGDYKSFDRNQTFPISYASSRAMLLLIEHANSKFGNYSAEDMVAVRTLLLGLCHPNYDFFGTLVRVLGTNPSGHPLTVQKNNVANSLYMRCAFIELAKIFTGAAPQVSSAWYAKAVAQINYGDDIIAAIAKGYAWFNHDTVAKIMSVWGIKFTHADKSTAVGRPYDRFEECTFVKRSWVYDHELCAYSAPLAPESLVKSLHYYHQGNSLSTVQQQVCLLRDVAENALCYGRDKYEQVCDLLTELAGAAGFAESDYAEATRYTQYDDFIERHKTNSMSNHAFSAIVCEGEAPKMRNDIGEEWMALVTSVSMQSNDIVDTTRRLTDVGHLHNLQVMVLFLDIIESVYDMRDVNCSVEISGDIFPHVIYTACGGRFALIDVQLGDTVRESTVRDITVLGYNGYIQVSSTCVHDGRWGGRSLSFPEPVPAVRHHFDGWNITRTSTTFGGNTCVVRVVCDKALPGGTSLFGMLVLFTTGHSCKGECVFPGEPLCMTGVTSCRTL